MLLVASALLLVLAFPPFRLEEISFFAFVPLFILFFDPACRRRFLVWGALGVGLIYESLFFGWLFSYDPGLFGAALALTGPLFPLYFLILYFFTRKFSSAFLKVTAAAAGWVVLHEIFRQTPIGSLLFEAPFYGFQGFYPGAALFGFVGVAALAMALNAAIALYFTRRSVSSFAALLIPGLLLAGLFGWGKIQAAQPLAPATLRAALVQHNLPDDLEWRELNWKFVERHYRRAAREAAPLQPDLTFFPLYTLPDGILNHRDDFFSKITRLSGSAVIAASHLPVPVAPTPWEEKLEEMGEAGFVNTALLYSKEGKEAGRTEAVRAQPLALLLKQLFSGQSPRYEPLEVPGGKAGILLCYEDALPEVTEQAVKSGAQFLAALSNTGWFTSTHLPDYHLIQDRLRALESHRWLVKVTPNGYSAIIDPHGRVVAQTGLDEEKVLAGKIGLESERTFYHRFPLLLPITAWLVMIGIGLARFIWREGF